jgi:hypothetical protein
MTTETKSLAGLGAARTLDELLAAVPPLGEFDSLEAVRPLADCDRRATGWLRTVAVWLLVLLSTATVMALVAGGLYLAGVGLTPVLSPSANRLIDGFGEAPLQVFLFILGAAITALFFNYAGPRQWLLNATGTFRRRIELRLLLLQAIQTQLNRNRKIVNNDWSQAVCQTCLAWYERYWVRFAYWRWLSFARCRKCHSDLTCYAQVRKIQGWLDHGMEESQGKSGHVVKVNMLHRLPAKSLALPTDLDELVIADVEDEDVETLIFIYRSKQPQTDLPRPKRLRFHFTGNSNVSLMGRRQLERNFAS